MRGWTLSAFDPRQTPRRSAERGAAAPDHCITIQRGEGRQKPLEPLRLLKELLEAQPVIQPADR